MCVCVYVQDDHSRLFVYIQSTVFVECAKRKRSDSIQSEQNKSIAASTKGAHSIRIFTECRPKSILIFLLFTHSLSLPLRPSLVSTNQIVSTHLWSLSDDMICNMMMHVAVHWIVKFHSNFSIFDQITSFNESLFFRLLHFVLKNNAIP